jgi:hypothetical protein
MLGCTASSIPQNWMLYPPTPRTRPPVHAARDQVVPCVAAAPADGQHVVQRQVGVAAAVPWGGGLNRGRGEGGVHGGWVLGRVHQGGLRGELLGARGVDAFGVSVGWKQLSSSDPPVPGPRPPSPVPRPPFPVSRLPSPVPRPAPPAFEAQAHGRQPALRHRPSGPLPRSLSLAGVAVAREHVAARQRDAPHELVQVDAGARPQHRRQRVGAVRRVGVGVVVIQDVHLGLGGARAGGRFDHGFTWFDQGSGACPPCSSSRCRLCKYLRCPSAGTRPPQAPLEGPLPCRRCPSSPP